MGFKNNKENNNSKGHKALNETYDTSIQSGPYKLGHSDVYETQQISPWLVPELTGAQWVEPLPQAGYSIIQAAKKSTPLSCIAFIHWALFLSEKLTILLTRSSILSCS